MNAWVVECKNRNTQKAVWVPFEVYPTRSEARWVAKNHHKPDKIFKIRVRKYVAASGCAWCRGSGLCPWCRGD